MKSFDKNDTIQINLDNSQYIHSWSDEEKISYFIVLAMEDKVNETHLFEALQMHNGYIKSPYMFTAQMVT